MGGRPACAVIFSMYRAMTCASCWSAIAWTSRRLDVNRHETGLDTPVVVDAHSTEHGVYGFRVERREEVGRVGCEPE